MAKIYFDKITLGAGQSLLIGHRPDLMTLDQMAKSKEGIDIDTESFGLFETTAPNFQTYYPDVKPEDLKPVDADYVKPIFRALSEVIVRRTSMPLDFSMNGVLKRSMNKLKGQTIYANHESVIGNDIGVVSNVFWEESYSTKNGIKIPAGINAEFKIDAKAQPKIARGILSDPPSIHSNSVTVSFQWEPSHPAMAKEEFFSKMGQKGADKQMIRRIATDIMGYHETSLVPHGDDPYAQVITEKGLNNPEYAKSQYSLSAQNKEKPKKYFFSFKDEVTSLSESSTPNINNNKPNENQMNKKLLELAEQHGIDCTNLSEEEISEQLNALLGSVTTLTKDLAKANKEKGVLEKKIETLGEEKETLTTEVSDLTTEKETLTTDATIGKVALEAKRIEVARLYNLLKGEKADKVLLDSFKKASYEQLTAHETEYTELAEEKIPLKCTECGSTSLSRGSSVGNATDETKENTTPLDNQQVISEFKKESKGKLLILGNKKPNK